LLKTCELIEYGGNVAECMHFASMFTTNVFLDNCDVDCVISMSLVSNTVAMFE